jgi:hypothetical protein
MTIRRTPRRLPKAGALAPLPCAARHRAFAARLRRGPVHRTGAPGVALTLRRLPTHVIERLHGLTRFCTRIVERSVMREPRPGVTPRATPAAVREIVRHERRTLLVRLIERRTHAVERLHARVIERGVEAAARTSAAMPNPVRTAVVRRVDLRHVYPPVARVLARAGARVESAAERREAPSLPAAPTSPQRAETRRGTAPGAAEPVTLPPHELSRVTEHVIAQLDRRVRSYRERMGLI